MSWFEPAQHCTRLLSYSVALICKSHRDHSLQQTRMGTSMYSPSFCRPTINELWHNNFPLAAPDTILISGLCEGK